MHRISRKCLSYLISLFTQHACQLLLQYAILCSLRSDAATRDQSFDGTVTELKRCSVTHNLPVSGKKGSLKLRSKRHATQCKCMNVDNPTPSDKTVTVTHHWKTGLIWTYQAFMPFCENLKFNKPETRFIASVYWVVLLYGISQLSYVLKPIISEPVYTFTSVIFLFVCAFELVHTSSSLFCKTIFKMYCNVL